MTQHVDDPKRRGPEGLRAIDRATSILFELAAHPQALTLADLARETGLTLTTVHRMIGALREYRLTRETPDGRQALGPGTLILARGFLGGLDFRVEALPVLSELRDATDEACHLGTLANPHIVYVDKLDSTRSVGVVSRIGATAPAVTTAVGRAILAYSTPAVVDAVVESTASQLGRAMDRDDLDAELAHTRRAGFSRDLGEHEPWVTCLGAPVFDEQGAPVAAIGLSIPTERFDRERAAEWGALVRRSADRISEALGYRAEAPDMMEAE
ncbi:IclR family transcriptional regulator [Microbacterium sp. zg-Y818]|uniref:IclR family transcriptional regulator n=1 Tax=unclassified Microbacterium TaxID=2609290 RepID=UPI00214D01B8|nr:MULTISPECIES: IclR family transcriptional regulator [unclassified Microbacterium]MCR2800219.1 IclR family transcriptional regulator [Microbacterium sp. zg.Y818]WIM22186.1 IclR family transcriptional regulator [Microbacterium sp. zg-Y818]